MVGSVQGANVNITLRCEQCGKKFERKKGQTRCPHVYCSMSCAAKVKRKNKTKAQKVAEKAAYDREYRARDPEETKRKSHESYRRNFDPEKAKIHRARAKRRKGKHHHRDYCRERFEKRPDLQAEKVVYDQKRKSTMRYGEYAECHALLMELEKLIRSKCPSDYERRKARGYYGNQRSTSERKRNA